MHLVNKLIFVYILILLLAPIGHFSSNVQGRKIDETGMARSFSNSSQIVSATAIGNNLSRSTYRVTGNLTIEANSTFKIINTVVSFSGTQFQVTRLNDYGNLQLYNSEIILNSPSTTGYSLNVTVKKTGTNQAELLMENSSLAFNGSLNLFNSRFIAANSSLNGTPGGNGFLGTDYFNSTVVLYNCTYSGERSKNTANEFLAGAEFNSAPLYSNIGYIPLHGQILQNMNSHVNKVDISLTYGGYNYGNASYILFNLSGDTVLKYVLNSTGYPFNETTVNLSIPFGGTLSSISSIEAKELFTAYFNMVPYKTNTTIFNVTIGFMSNDSVSFYGRKYFGPVAYNTTFYAIGTRFRLGYGTVTTSAGEYNPEKNAVFLYGNSTFYSIGSYAAPVSDPSSTSPFELWNSSLFVFSLQYISDTSPEGKLNGFLNDVSANNLNSSLNVVANEQNSLIRGALKDFGLVFSGVSLNGSVQVPLIRAYSNSSSLMYFSNYRDEVAGHAYYFSENSSSIYLNKSSPLAFNINLPELKADMTHSSAVYEGKLNLNLSVSSLYGASSNLTVYVNASSYFFSANLRTLHLNLTNNQAESFNWSYVSFNGLLPGTYNLTVAYAGVKYTFNSNNSLYRGSLSVFSNIDLSLKYNYSWISPVKDLLLNATISNNGNQFANGTSVIVSFYDKTKFLGDYSTLINLAPESSALIPVSFQSGSAITNATVSLVPASTIRPYDTSGEVTVIRFESPTPPARQYFLLNITRSGLPSNTPWTMVINNTVFQTISHNILINVPAGNQTLTIQDITGYHPLQGTYTLSITGNTSVGVVFLQNNYTVHFIVKGGLPPYGWSLKIGNHTFVPYGRTFNFTAHDGVYIYNVTSIPGYSISNGSGKFGVDNSNITVVISFEKVQRAGTFSIIVSWLENLSPAIAVSVAVAGTYGYIWNKKSSVIYLNEPRNASSILSRLKKSKSDSMKDVGNEKVNRKS